METALQGAPEVVGHQHQSSEGTGQGAAGNSGNKLRGCVADILCKVGLRKETYEKYAGRLETVQACLDILELPDLPQGVYEVVDGRMESLLG